MTGKVYKRQKKKSSYVSKGTGAANQYRKRRPPKMLTEKQKLYRKTKEQVDLVNKRLRNLERGGFYDSWASKKLINRLSKGKIKGKKIMKNKKVKISKDLSMTHLLNINKATRMFLESKTSSTRGIRDTRKSVIGSLSEHFGSINKPISYEQAEIMYDLFDNTEFEDIARNSSSSDIWVPISDYLTHSINKDTLIDRLIRYGNVDYNNDADMRDKVNDMIKYLDLRR